MKAGYPPHNLTLVPELPIDSLGLKQGEQLIVTQRAETAHRPVAAVTSAVPPGNPSVPMIGSQSRRPITPPPSTRPLSGPDYVETDGGYLIHRVRQRVIVLIHVLIRSVDST